MSGEVKGARDIGESGGGRPSWNAIDERQDLAASAGGGRGQVAGAVTDED